MMRVTSSNWVVLGWRPQGLTSSYQSFPDLNGGFELPEQDAEPEPEGMD